MATLCLPATLAAQGPFSEDFEGYSPGTSLYHVGGWSGWDDVAGAAGTVSNAFAHGGSNSIRIDPTTDAVHPFAGITSGEWIFTGYIYIASGDLPAGTLCYFIVNNEYAHGGPYQWAMQTSFSGSTNMVNDDLRSSTPQPIQFDQWVEVRAEFDLTGNTCTQYYDGAMISTGVFNIQGGPLEFANIDLFNAGGRAYWDDLSLAPPPPPMAAPAASPAAILALIALLGAAFVLRTRP